MITYKGMHTGGQADTRACTHKQTNKIHAHEWVWFWLHATVRWSVYNVKMLFSTRHCYICVTLLMSIFCVIHIHCLYAALLVYLFVFNAYKSNVFSEWNTLVKSWIYCRHVYVVSGQWRTCRVYQYIGHVHHWLALFNTWNVVCCRKCAQWHVCYTLQGRVWTWQQNCSEEHRGEGNTNKRRWRSHNCELFFTIFWRALFITCWRWVLADLLV